MFKRLGTLVRGFFSLFISGIEKANPAALIEAEKENLRKQIARFNENLASHAGFVERLLRQIKSLEQKEKELTARVAANIKAGNRTIAGQIALELQTVKSQLEENREQMVAAEETYKKLLKTRDVAVSEAQSKIEKLKRMMSETQMMEAQAELQEMAKGMITQIGGSGDTLNRVEEYLNERRDKAAGRARVASSSIDTSQIDMKDAEQAALADQALADFEMAYGIKPAQAESASIENSGDVKPVKDLGPQQQ
jgi:phage shock protein A